MLETRTLLSSNLIFFCTCLKDYLLLEREAGKVETLPCANRHTIEQNTVEYTYIIFHFYPLSLIFYFSWPIPVCFAAFWQTMDFAGPKLALDKTQLVHFFGISFLMCASSSSLAFGCFLCRFYPWLVEYPSLNKGLGAFSGWFCSGTQFTESRQSLWKAAW